MGSSFWQNSVTGMCSMKKKVNEGAIDALSEKANEKVSSDKANENVSSEQANKKVSSEQAN